MFKCGQCGEQQASGVKPVRVVVERRTKVYFEDGREVGHGWEIVQERNLCPECVSLEARSQ